jgi:hypothetical protein
MKIDLSKNIFSSKEIKHISIMLSDAHKRGYLQKRKENNAYLAASYAGVEEKGITPKWNIKIYTYSFKKKGHSIVCVDKLILKQILEQDYDSFTPPDLKLLSIDDAGWGFPMCGVMVGVSDEQKVKTATVPVEYFRNDTRNHFKTKKYLKEYTRLALHLVEEFGAAPETHRIEICTGYINQPLREKLRKLKYHVRVVEIKGMLQATLENIYKKYVIDTIGADIYYDPKEIKKEDIPKMYYESVRYGKKNCPDQLKNGWEAFGRM